jgi:alpha-tubulin suppressor-like RCC1 family protein
MKWSRLSFIFLFTVSAIFLQSPNQPTEADQKTPARADVIGFAALEAVAIDVGGGHACAIINDGSARCWGANGLGQLGDGTRQERTNLVDRNTPYNVTGLTASVRGVATGEGHTCVVLATGAVSCWGDNRKYQLGNGHLPPQPRPQPHEFITSGAVQIVAGDHHNCVVTTDGAVRCWGNNSLEQLGISAETPASGKPYFVSGFGTSLGGTAVQTIASSSNGVCALTMSGGVSCWGDDNPFPSAIAGLSKGVTGIAAGGSHYCAIHNGAVKCWGNNANGQLGDGTTTKRTTPTAVIGLDKDVISLDAGSNHTCALLISRSVKCWGANESGQLGDGSNMQRNTPTLVSGLSQNVTAISAGKTQTCAITGGTIKCWGNVSIPPSPFRSKPETIEGISDSLLGGGVVNLALGEKHTCLLSYAGSILCWGNNTYGQLGNGTYSNHTTPREINTINDGIRNIVAGAYHTCLLTVNNMVYCWGKNEQGQLGIGDVQDIPYPVSVKNISNDIVSISAGWGHSCAQTRGGGVKCWGLNNYGQLGSGNTTNTSLPTDVLNLSNNVRAITTGGTHACALLTDGGVKCWGNNSNGQLGTGDNQARSLASPVIGLDAGAIAIEAGANHTCALLNNGVVQCWGANGYGQLGDGTTTDQSNPIKPSNITERIIAISAGGFATCEGNQTYCGAHTCAITANGQAVCWGRNNNGQLGNGNYLDANLAQLVNGANNVFAIEAGGGHTCALSSGQDQTPLLPMCWGADQEGQLSSVQTIQTVPGGVFWYATFITLLQR